MQASTPKKKLTDRTLLALKAAPKGTRYELRDTEASGLRLRVTDKAASDGRAAQRSFMLLARYPGAKHPARRALGTYPELSLAEAREKARQWNKLISRGIDPQDAEAKERQAAAAARKNTFAAVAEDFIAEKLPSERKGKEVARDIRRDLLAAWGAKPITEISDLDVLGVIKTKKRAAPAQARNLLGTVKRMFRWAVDQRCYGLKISPADSLKPSTIIGEKISGQRILTDDELHSLWRVAKRMPYPYGSVYQILILTGLRLNEAADAAWSEFDLRKGLWTIPAARMKGKNSKARPHAVPLTDELLAILQKLPRFNRGDHLFSTTFGARPVWMTDKVKERVDRRMLRTLRALARQCGDDPEKVTLAHWTNHDIRRTVRSGLSRLKVTEEAREAIMAHARPGIKGVYDHHDYFEEKREALDLWAKRVRELVEPPPPNVVQFAAREGA
jgi:integrase